VVSTDDSFAYDDADEGTASLITKQGRPGQWQISDTKGIDIVLDDTLVDNDDTVNLLQIRDVTEDEDDLLRFKVRPQGKMEQSPISPVILSNAVNIPDVTPTGFSFISENRLYLATDPCFQIYDIGVSNRPLFVRTITGIFDSPADLSNTTCLQVHRDFIMTTFLGSSPAGGVAFYDVADDNTEVVNAKVLLNGDATQVISPSLEKVFDFASWGDFNFYPDFENSKITVVNVQDPLNPIVVAVLDDISAGGFLFIDKPVAIDVSEGVLYYSNTGTTFRGIVAARLVGENASAARPVFGGFFDLSTNPNDNLIGRLAARGSHVLAGAGNNFDLVGNDRNLYAIDFDDITVPTLLDKIQVSNRVSQIQFDENIAYVSSLQGTGPQNILTILDVSDLVNMKTASVIGQAFAVDGLGVALKGNDLYLISDTGGVEKVTAIDIQGIKTQAITASQADLGNLTVTTKTTTRRLEVTDTADFGHGGINTLGPITGISISTMPTVTQQSFLNDLLPTTFTLDSLNDLQIFDFFINQTEDIILNPTGNIIPGHQLLLRLVIDAASAAVFILNDSRYVFTGITPPLLAGETYYVTMTNLLNFPADKVITVDIKQETP